MQKDFEAFIGQWEQAQGRSWRLAKGKTFCVCGKKKRRRKRCEEEFFSSYVWRGAHGKCVWKNEAWNGVVGSKLS